MTGDAIRERSRRAVEEKVFPGCVVGVVSREGERLVIPEGKLSYESGAHLVRAATVYDLASVTKSIPVASLAVMLIEAGRLQLSDLVSAYIPELRNDHGATIEDLLRYRVRGIRLSTLGNRTFEEVRTRILEHGFDASPGESAYTNLPAYVLGIAIERVTQASLAELGERYLFGPLQMRATTFFPTPSDCASTEIDRRGEVTGLPHDESAYRFALARRSVGHAGLFSTAPDLLAFLEALLAGRYPAISSAASVGLGWQTSGDFLGSYASAGSFGKTGFTGTSVAIDPIKGIAFAILSNRTYPKRPPDNSAINSFRRDVADIILGER